MSELASIDESHMSRALALAALGRGRVEPNPMVGCVIARGRQILGEGFHQQFGAPHAEPNALAAVAAAGADPSGATAFVTLEPCCHTDKKTPPCVPILIRAGLARIAIACLDPNPLVSGRGADQLRAAGLAVDVGLFESSAHQLNAAYFTRIGQRRPYVTLKWAQSADGKVAGPGSQRIDISNARSRRLVLGLRALSDAILIGIRTALTDDPLLTARNVPAVRPLLRVVLDSTLRLPVTSRLAQSVDRGPILLACSPAAAAGPSAATLHRLGIELLPLPLDDDSRLSLPALLTALANRHITHLMVEPGPTLARSFLSQNLADRVWMIRSPKSVAPASDPSAPSAVAVPADWPTIAESDLDGDRLTEFLNPHSPAFFATQPSPDFTLLVNQPPVP